MASQRSSGVLEFDGPGQRQGNGRESSAGLEAFKKTKSNGWANIGRCRTSATIIGSLPVLWLSVLPAFYRIPRRNLQTLSPRPARWVADRDDKIANRYFQLLETRCAKTDLGRFGAILGTGLSMKPVPGAEEQGAKTHSRAPGVGGLRMSEPDMNLPVHLLAIIISCVLLKAAPSSFSEEPYPEDPKTFVEMQWGTKISMRDGIQLNATTCICADRENSNAVKTPTIVLLASVHHGFVSRRCNVFRSAGIFVRAGRLPLVEVTPTVSSTCIYMTRGMPTTWLNGVAKQDWCDGKVSHHVGRILL